jgi:Ca-activated chloride channel homolog
MTKRMTRSAGVAFLVALLALAGCSSKNYGPGSSTPNKQSGGDAGAAIPGGETAVGEQAQSTFALDVDTASYAYALRQLHDGRWPDPSTLRPEEFVNSFDMDYGQPKGDGFALHVDGSAMPSSHRSEYSSRLRLMRVGLQTRGEDSETRPDVALTFVIDVSGSMAETGRLDLVQDALHYLVRQLRSSDAVGLVTFNETARMVLPLTRVSQLEDLDRAIDKLRPGGSTNLESGLVTGYQVARDGFRQGYSNRVILLSDGLANVGNTESAPILRKVKAEADKEITLLGVGVGSSYGDELMEKLADQGDGFAVYVANRDQARDVFVHRLPANISVRAMDAKAQVTFDEAAVEAYRLVGYDDRRLDASEFRDDRVDGGEVGPGHAVTALYIVRLRPEVQSEAKVADVRVRWQDPTTRAASEAYESVVVNDLASGFRSADPHLRVAYAAAFFAEALKSSRYAAEVQLGQLEQIAADASEELRDPKVGELADAIRTASRLRA